MKQIIRKLNIKKSKGFALVFVMMIVGTISIISAGLLSAGLKQMELSSLAKDTEAAFYQADTASECAYYAEFVERKDITKKGTFESGPQPWSCGGQNLTVKSTGDGGFEAKFTDDSQNSPCFRIEVSKTPSNNKEESDVTINAYGYNMCNKSNSRTVERLVKTTYTLPND